MIVIAIAAPAAATNMIRRDPAIIHASAQRDGFTHFSRLQHGRHILTGVERHNELALVGESAEGGDALDVGGGDLQESSRPAVGAVAELLQLPALSVVVDVRLLKNTVEPLT